MRLVARRLAWITFLPVLPCVAAPPDRHALEGVHRVVFLGDSITYAGDYIAFTEAFLRLKRPDFRGECLNLGLPSETVSGLSEPGHAGGAFPRPVLSERLDRVLRQTKPDLIVACYGMNDGIYHPFSEERFAKFQEGIRVLRERAERAGARIVHLTPPVFDSVPIRTQTLPAGREEYRQPFEGYDGVLERYSAWLLSQRLHGWDVVDLHGPLRRSLESGRLSDPAFRLADDGVHLNATGHWIIARQLLRHWGATDAERNDEGTAAEVFGRLPRGTEVLRLVQQRQTLLKDAWLTATGHQRPGMSKGVPLDEARRQAQEIETRLLRLTERIP